jgi:hypothetical protein
MEQPLFDGKSVRMAPFLHIAACYTTSISNSSIPDPQKGDKKKCKLKSQSLALE